MKLYGYTTVYRYVYANENIENFYYFCSDECMPSDKEVDEVKWDLEIESNDTFELFGHTANDFNGDDYLSDGLQFVLTTEDIPQEYTDLQLAYITLQHIDKEDKIGIIKSLIKLYEKRCDFKQYRKMYKVNHYALKKLLLSLGEAIEINSNNRSFVVKRLRSVLNHSNNDILLKMVAAKDVRIVKSYLDRMEKLYKIKDEKSKYRVGIIFMLFIERCELLLPMVRCNLSLGSSLMAEYYDIDPPTYRKDKLISYCDKNQPLKPLYKIILNEQIAFWEILKR